MGTKPEQLDRRYDTPGCRKYLKRAVRRWRRRLEKRDPEGTPIKACYKGWS